MATAPQWSRPSSMPSRRAACLRSMSISCPPRSAKPAMSGCRRRGLEAPGKEAEMKKFAFLINNGRANVTWQSSYLDQDNEFVTDRMAYPYMEMNPKDMEDLKLKAGDLIEVYNDNGSTQAMVYPAPSAKQE